MAFKREDWNKVIRDVNEVLENPPGNGDCDPIPPLTEVGPNHRWAKSDVRAVQDKIKQTCPTITFATIPDLWKQDILDEIYAKLAQAWCDCDCDTGPEESFFTIFTSEAPRVKGFCLGDPAGGVEQSFNITGMQVGASGITSRSWRLLKRRITNAGTITDTLLSLSGSVSCAGTVNGGAFTQHVEPEGPFVSCVICLGEGGPQGPCTPSYVAAQQTLDTNPGSFATYSYIVRVRKSTFSTCQECS